MALGSMTRGALALTAGIAIYAGTWIAVGATELTVHNNAMTVAYPALYAGGASLAAAGAFGLAALYRRWARYAAAAAGAAALLFALQRLTFRLEAGNEGLVTREFGLTHRVPWREIAQVDVGADGTFVVTADARRISMDTGLPAESAAIINRTVARRVREAGAR
jgi:hypothetical protein